MSPLNVQDLTIIPLLGLTSDTSAANLLLPSKREVDVQAKAGASTTTYAQVPPSTTTTAKSASDINFNGKVHNFGAPSVSPPAAKNFDSQSLSDALEKMRMIYEKCPKCLLPS